MPPTTPSPTDPTAGHSPLPWRLAEDGRIVCDSRWVGTINVDLDTDCGMLHDPEGRANAALILRAVNHHHALVVCADALRAAEVAIRLEALTKAPGWRSLYADITAALAALPQES